MDQIKQAAQLISQSARLVIFTGAGISTESGLADFRSPGGLWEKYDPSEFTYDRIVSDKGIREKYWQFQKVLWPGIVEAQPNAAHLAIVELDRLKKLDHVITQNIDGLHQKAGLAGEKVIELHGTNRWVLCLSCAKRYSREEIQQRLEDGEQDPTCDDCGGIMKPATISFGQAMPVKETRLAESKSASCDLFMVIGSSLVVYPAAQMPVLAKRSGAKLIIINATPTPHDDYADIVIQEQAGKAMEDILAQL